MRSQIFQFMCVVGCVVLYTGQGKFHESTTDTLNYVVSQSNNTVSSLKNVSSILSAAKDIEIDQVSLPSNVKTDIVRVHNMINDASKKLQFETRKNEKDIKHVLKDVRLALIIIAAVMLLVALLGFLFSMLGLQFLVCILVILGWILVTATLILCGIFLALHKYVNVKFYYLYSSILSKGVNFNLFIKGILDLNNSNFDQVADSTPNFQYVSQHSQLSTCFPLTLPN
ncbi:putative transmembrane protein [Helianthus annuus]|nr:putative transmembrane protein [Helianthus annuus]KAJ0643315.1 putative transmembrane protein [Helianthus annuus]KAJ0819420.1 putative transmembrane protein [Helianthus annuus]